MKIDIKLDDETVWLTQEQMARLFGKVRTTITGHIGNIFKEGELVESMVCRNFRHTTQHGAKGQSVGYVKVSTLLQNAARQLEGFKLDHKFTDKISGKDKNRPEFKRCMKHLRAGDTLHVHSIDRLARNLRDLETIVKKLVGNLETQQV
jgi:hypothetical protein